MAEKLTHAVGQEPTKPKAQRTAFDGPGTTSAVTLAVKPRQVVYRRGRISSLPARLPIKH